MYKCFNSFVMNYATVEKDQLLSDPKRIFLTHDVVQCDPKVFKKFYAVEISKII